MKAEQEFKTPYNEYKKRTLGQEFARIFSKPKEDQDYTLEVIESLFKKVELPVPEALIQAHLLMKKRIPTMGDDERDMITPLDRADWMMELVTISHELETIYSMWDAMIDQLEEILLPPKEYTENGKVIKVMEAERKAKMQSELAPFKAISNIIFYMFYQCGKTIPYAVKEVLAIEKSMLRFD